MTTPGRPRRRAGRLSWGARRIPGRAHPGRGLCRLDDRHHRPRRSRPGPDRAAGSIRRGDGGAGHRRRYARGRRRSQRRAIRDPLVVGLSYYGHDQVRVLDGGWNRWVKEGRPVEAGEVAVARGSLHAPSPARAARDGRATGRAAGPSRSRLAARRRPRRRSIYRARRRGRAAAIFPVRSTSLASCSLRRTADFSRSTKSASASTNTGSAPTGRPSLIAMAASRPPSFSSTWRGWASPIWPTTMAPGTNGAAGSIFPWNPDGRCRHRLPARGDCRTLRSRWRTHLIRVNDYHKTYRETVAVAGLSFEVPAGAILGLVGPNGAGKTTTMRALAGIIRPTRGTLSIAGHDVVPTRWPPSASWPTFPTTPSCSTP